MSVTGFIVRVCLLFLVMAENICAHSDASGFANEEVVANNPEANVSSPRRYPAQVNVDPREITGVVLKVNARILSIGDLYRGRPVNKGEVLAEFESAELETVQRSYAETYKNLEYIREISVTTDEKLIQGQMNLLWRGLSREDIDVLEESRDPVKRLRITAPRDGYIFDLAITNGQVVNPGAQSGLFSLSGTTLMRISSDEAITVDAEIPLRLAANLEPGDPAWLYLAPGAQPLDAIVDEVIPVVGNSVLRQTVRLRPLASARLLGLRDGQRLAISLQLEEKMNAQAH